MSSTITRVKTIRMRNETADWLDGMDARAVIESVHGLVENGSLIVDGCFLKISKNKKGGRWQDIERACDTAGIEPDKAVDKFIKMIYKGEL